MSWISALFGLALGVAIGAWVGVRVRDVIDARRARHGVPAVTPLRGCESITGPQTRDEGVRLVRIK